jgi:hypothetical protein
LALSKVIEEIPVLRDKIGFVCYGHSPGWLQPMVNDIGLSDPFEVKGFYKHENLQVELKKIYLFLSTTMKVEGGRWRRLCNWFKNI